MMKFVKFEFVSRIKKHKISSDEFNLEHFRQILQGSFGFTEPDRIELSFKHPEQGEIRITDEAGVKTVRELTKNSVSIKFIVHYDGPISWDEQMMALGISMSMRDTLDRSIDESPFTLANTDLKFGFPNMSHSEQLVQTKDKGIKVTSQDMKNLFGEIFQVENVKEIVGKWLKGREKDSLLKPKVDFEGNKENVAGIVLQSIESTFNELQNSKKEETKIPAIVKEFNVIEEESKGETHPEEQHVSIVPEFLAEEDDGVPEEYKEFWGEPSFMQLCRRSTNPACGWKLGVKVVNGKSVIAAQTLIDEEAGRPIEEGKN